MVALLLEMVAVPRSMTSDVNTYLHMYVYIYACMYVCIYVYMYVCSNEDGY